MNKKMGAFIAGVVTIVAILVAGLILWCRQNTREERTVLFYEAVEKIKGFALDWIFDAEQIYQSGTGQFKKAYVIGLILNSGFYTNLPAVVQKMVTYGVLSELVDVLVGTVFNTVKQSNKEVQELLAETNI